MAFDDTQVQALTAKLSVKHVRTRQEGNLALSYIEGWHAIAEANRIFGYDAWDRETVEAKCVWEGTSSGLKSCSYIARVRVRVRAGDTLVVREGSGSGHGVGLTPGAAHESALKEAETDAMKRALTTFGNPFGLALYDKEKKAVTRSRKPSSDSRSQHQDLWVVRSPRGRPVASYSDPREFCSNIRSRVEALETKEALEAFWGANLGTFDQLQKCLPALRDENDRHYAAILTRLYEARLETFTKPDRQEPKCDAPTQAESVDKSVLPIGAPRRVRDKDHLVYVASRPCMICGRSPSQAHHVRFAQPRALSRKVSDEWVVPLCATHHREVHAQGNEELWWRERSLDPIPEALRLWKVSHDFKGNDQVEQAEAAPPSVSPAMQR
jgi:DNA recombination protein Rad52